ncbi:hypothetical protein N5C46_15960 [Rossellomorea vietnamensis]|uniref:Uncharacterized protein n=1 Tax=Rossellomorea vietnamensis TaxID=218284 RepID=A0ACD4C3V9_9BACI|nr:hypothetical protein [Rossellomorea vietnamensis]UXH43177.1 hypothetical protein N5C46_15960 [Rossellomorea vietnamensis]
MNKDPFQNIKNEIEKEIFQKTTPVSQKRAIMKKIRSEKQHRFSFKTICINIAAPLCFIVILSILTSSYLFQDEKVKENETEETEDQFTFIPVDKFDEQIQDEKAWTRRSANPVKKIEEEREFKEEEVQNEEQKETPEADKVVPLALFDFTDILNRPEVFKQEAGKGTFMGTPFTIGDSMDDIQAQFEDRYEVGKEYDRVENYLLQYREKERKLSQIQSSISSVYTLKQVIETLGDPYYAYDGTREVFNAKYYYGDYMVILNLDGQNKGEPYTEAGVQIIDRSSYITSISLLKKDRSPATASSDVKYLGDEEKTVVFRTEWLDEAREEVVNNTKAIEVLLRSQQDPLEFNIVVPQETSEKEIKHIAHSFLKKLTDASSEEKEEESLWNTFSYIVHIENGIDGYYDTGVSYGSTTNDSSPINQWGYPEIIWTDGLKLH